MKRAIILAAGLGQRLRPHTDRVPKVLVEVGGETMLGRMMGQLVELGINEIVVAVGDRASLVEGHLATLGCIAEISVMRVPEFATTNNSQTLWHCRQHLQHGCLLIEGDVVTTTEVLAGILASAEEAVWACRTLPQMMGGAYLEARDGTDLLRQVVIVPAAQTENRGRKSLGLLKIGPSFGTAFGLWLDEERQAGRWNRYYDLVISDHALEYPVHLLELPSGFWMEVDTPADLEAARRGVETTFRDGGLSAGAAKGAEGESV